MHGEGTPVAVDTIAESLSRCPDGADTGDNLNDFHPTLPTPGGSNFCGDDNSEVTFADVNAIYANKCGTCHTSSSFGGHAMGAGDVDAAYTDSQLISYSDGSQSKGEHAIERIETGSMPQGKGCGGPVADNADNADVCITDTEFDILLDWLDAGEPAP